MWVVYYRMKPDEYETSELRHVTLVVVTLVIISENSIHSTAVVHFIHKVLFRFLVAEHIGKPHKMINFTDECAEQYYT